MIATADWHLQMAVPRCRQETEAEWFQHQARRLNWIVDMANSLNQDLYIAGDITDKAITSPAITRMFIMAMLRLKGTCYVMPGNHCLPNHSLDKMGESNYGILDAIAQGAGNIKTIDQSPYAYVPYGQDGVWLGKKVPQILFIHRLVFASQEDMPPNAEAITARSLLGLYPGPKVLVTGDNHTKFHAQMGGRSVVNCGCITKRTIDFQDKDLAIWMINEDTFEVQEIPIPDNSILVRDNHVEVRKENEEKFKALVEILKDAGAMTLDFLGNLRDNSNSLSAEGKAVLEEVV